MEHVSPESESIAVRPRAAMLRSALRVLWLIALAGLLGGPLPAGAAQSDPGDAPPPATAPPDGGAASSTEGSTEGSTEDPPAGDPVPPADVTPPAAERVDVARLTARIEQLTTAETAGELSDAGTDELALLREAKAFLDRASEMRRANDQFALEIRAAPESLAQKEAYLAVPIDEQTPAAASYDALSLPELQAELESARVRLQSERDLRAKVETDATYRSERRTQIPTERSEATERLDELRALLAAGATGETPTDLAQAQRWTQLAEVQALEATLERLDTELRSYDQRRVLLDKRRSYRDRRIQIELNTVNLLQAKVGERETAQANEAREAAANQADDARDASPVLQAVLAENARLTQRNFELTERSSEDAQRRTDRAQALADRRELYARSKERVERAGLTNAIGLYLRSQRQRLPDPAELRNTLDEREKWIGTLVNEAEDLRLQREQLVDLSSEAVDEYMDNLALNTPLSATERATIRDDVRTALELQREYVSTLALTINVYVDETLLELQSTEREDLQLVIELRDFIDERILWIRSADPLALSDLRETRNAVVRLLDRSDWADLLGDLGQDALLHPIIYVVFLIGFLVLVFRVAWLGRRLHGIGEQTKRLSTDRLTLTVRAILITMVKSLVVPAPFLFVAWRLHEIGLDDVLASRLANGMIRAAQLILIAEFIRGLCRSDGVGVAHFKWNAPMLAAVRTNLRWVTPTAGAMAFLVGATEAIDRDYDSLGRIAFIIEMIVAAELIRRVLRPSAAPVKAFLTNNAGGWLDRLKYVWYPVIVLIPISTAIVAATGYFYSAVRLEEGIVRSIALVVLILLFRAFALRSLFLAQRRLKIEQRRKQMAAKAESAKAEAAKAEAARAEAGPVSTTAPSASGGPTHPVGDAHAEIAPTVAEPENVDVASVSAQTRQLLDTVVVAVLCLCLAWVWIDVLPALGFFEQIELWSPDSTVVAVSESAGDAPLLPGTESTSSAAPTVPTDGPITLGNLLAAIVILIVTVLFSRNLPGLLEIALLQRLPISASGRYATTTIARYVLITVGIVLAFSAVGIGWSKVQWLAAAVTVGLGFGLQEIFANFVSGLIILFERPIRVGDTVTVNGISGTVYRLRIRATTIVDWDRKELIIPNKEFVTGQIINWTLDDPMLRLVIPVGIAYGSDTKLAEEILLQVARDEPVVLKEPKTTVVFTEFGDSALIFKLRVFIPHIDNYFGVQHRLHNAIDAAFRKAGITIAFPQVDVHFHPVGGSAATLPAPGESSP